MPHVFDPGYCAEPFQTLCREYPDESVYPPAAFRTEWGPVFHRGRLDGTARILIIGQDPAQHEIIARRILVGEAGQRVQGFLARMGIDRSYVMVNTFLYSVYGQSGGYKHKHDPDIVAYRNRWIDAVFSTSPIEAVVALGALADDAFRAWKNTPAGKSIDVASVHITHPTQPEGSSRKDKTKYAAAITAMLQNWNAALATLVAVVAHPDRAVLLKPYGTKFMRGDTVEIPEMDMPAGLPSWTRSPKNWAQRTGTTATTKRATIVVKVPSAFRH
jgi:uracil-DNA glycosylase